MNSNEWELIQKSSQILFKDPTLAEKKSSDTLAVLESSHKFRQDQLFDATLRSLLRQASTLPVLKQDFFTSLSISDQLLLFLVKEGSQSYQKIHFLTSGVFEEQTMEFEKKLWGLRLQSAHQNLHALEQLSYSHLKPFWQQRFLDDQMIPEEFIQTQNHLAVCLSCQELLHQAQKVIQLCDQSIPTVSSEFYERSMDAVNLSKNFRVKFFVVIFIVAMITVIALFTLVRPS